MSPVHASRMNSPAPLKKSDAKASPAAKPKAIPAKTENVIDVATSEREPMIWARSVQCFLLMGSRLFQQAMRNSLAPLMVYVAREFSLTTEEKGSLLASVAVGYFFTQVLGGRLKDKFGAKNTLSASMALSALCCLAIPTCIDYLGVPGLWAAMATMGAVQGPLFPVSMCLMSKWLPKETPGGSDEKAWGTSILDLGVSVGSLAIIPFSNYLSGTLGWRHAYHIIGLATLAFVAVFQLLGADEPATCWYISRSELAFLKKYVRAAVPVEASSANVGILGIPNRLMLHPGLWAVWIAHIAFNFSAYFHGLWGPTYFADVMKMTPEESQYHLMAPYAANLVFKFSIPFLLKFVKRVGFGSLGSRRLFMTVGYLLAAGSILPAFRMRESNPWLTTTLFSLGHVGYALASVGFKSNYLEVTQQYVGELSGLGNTLATAASWAGPKLVASMLGAFSQNWDVVFLSLAVANTAAALNFFCNSTVSPIEHDIDNGKKVDPN